MITTKVKSAELIGNALDYIVAKLENHEWRNHWILEDRGFQEWNSYEMSFGNPTPNYSSDWNKAGIIIDREQICTLATGDSSQWKAYKWDDAKQNFTKEQYAPTPPIAAMRCYVASKLGDEVEIPLDIV
jgi:hypothetical protein